ncbi:ABC transporter ATP-binding protein [Iodidimonas muriae]|uniref:ABC transporter ATP-binding protein n=1 Tax=Iodidimonas muriae TaxID=261467 RepID=A0ABQ2LDB3_9PROT|nr:ABC transporter ATP-binding protein [Iodidimonas muriae]GER07947.1 ABC transporter ATP-binding protein [Kordiimonadales bacterium JCM 17843]GGO11810.1 ABC transporter ATP-binding protein [Iodidimonas muriae]
MNTIVTLDGVTKRYGKLTALENATLTLGAGEAVALVGHNGAGKTTLMKLVLGLIRPNGGTVRVLEKDPAGRKGAQLRRRLGFLPESVAFHSAMTGEELLGFYARLKRAPHSANKALLHQVGLAEATHRRVGTYSKGMRQRLALAQALIGTPDILLLDEPTSGLDPASRAQVYATIDRLRASGATILVSTHALAEIEPHVDRAILLHQGRIIAAGDLASLRKNARLPTRIRLKVAPCSTEKILTSLHSDISLLHRSADRLDLAVAQTHKLDLLLELAALRDMIEDLHVEEPGLEALYHHLMSEVPA